MRFFKFLPIAALFTSCIQQQMPYNEGCHGCENPTTSRIHK